MSTKTNSRKILLPLATLLVAAAVAVGSGATFTSTSDSAISATAGTLTHVNSEDTATLTVDNLKPGASEVGQLTITNSGSLDSELTLVASASLAAFETGAVTLTVTATTDDAIPVVTEVYSGNIEDFNTVTPVVLDNFVAGQLVEDFITLDFTIAMDTNASNFNQGKSASVALAFVTTQTDATNNESILGWILP